MRNLSIAILSFIQLTMMYGQAPTLAEKLGYPADARLLIVHADDAAVSHSTNQAIFDAFEKGAITSTAIMVPCPWFPEMATYAVQHPEYDYGLHLTYTSEWNTYKWGGLAPDDEISSLINKQGYFYPTTAEAVNHADPAEVEKEMRAQIDKALSFGIMPSHLDSHMLPHFGNQEVFNIYLKLGEEYHIPVLLSQEYLDEHDNLQIPESYHPVIIDEIFEATPEVLPSKWTDHYDSLLRNIGPGVYELIFHLAYADEETRAMTQGFEYYDVAWRQRDLDYAMSSEFQKVLQENNIQLITWKQIQQVMYP